MKLWLFRIAALLSLLLLLAFGAWWVWREWFSADQFREAVAEGIKTGDFRKAERLKAWGANTKPWRKEDSNQQLNAVILNRDIGKTKALIAFGVNVNGNPKDRPTPLISAIISCDSSIVNLLIDSGADVSRGDLLDIARTAYKPMYASGVDYSTELARIEQYLRAARARPSPLSRNLEKDSHKTRSQDPSVPEGTGP